MHPHYKDQPANSITERIAVQCEKRTESINTLGWGGGLFVVTTVKNVTAGCVFIYLFIIN